MKFISYKLGADGAATWGLVREDGVVDLGARGPHKSMRDAIAAGDLMSQGQAGMSGDPDTVLPDVTFLPVITDPDKILCAGLNYKDHVTETANTLPAELQLFMRSTNTLIGHCGEMERPKVSDNYDFEGELTAIIGKGGRHISEADALDHVAGYTIFIDGSVRDYQKHSVTAGKNFYKSGPLDPAQRRDGAAFHHRYVAFHRALHHLLHLAVHAAGARRRDRDRNPERGRRPTQSAAVDEGGRPDRGRDIEGRHPMGRRG
jgi:2-keto-4-pentenoate hydratase/2-oxohepta-3-ene-1,7-dioic acid hydratase in catechol pathway